MTIAEDSRNLPDLALASPDHCEVGEPFALATSDLAEAMAALRDGTEVLDRVNDQRARDQLACEMSARVLLCVREHVLPVPRDSTRVVIELDVFGEVAGMLLQLTGLAAVIERIEHCGIKCGDGISQ